ncbi:MAG: arginine--tRNA ligase [Pirellulaceae bacterium]|nr:arginine--tRNA ligase [Pirellulaceae bacterium]
MRLLDTVRLHVQKALKPLTSDTSDLLHRITATRDSQFGDYQANLSLAMILGKQLGRDPIELANLIAASLQLDPIFASVDVAGKGYINMQLSDAWVVDQASALEASDNLTLSKPTHPKTYIVDYSSPNVAKPMHVGHIRSTVIGDAIVRILRCLGHRVISDNHLGDWGTQFGMVIYGYKNFNDAQAFTANPVAELSRQYRLVQQIIGYQSAKEKLEPSRRDLSLLQQRLAETQALLKAIADKKSPDEKKLAKQLKSIERGIKDADESIEELQNKIAAIEQNPSLLAIASTHTSLEAKVLNETAKLHSSDTENLRLWHEFLPHCKAEIQQIYHRLGIHFDYELGESFYHTMLEPTVDELLHRGVAVESQGAVCVFLDGFDAPMIIRKQDGAFLYATTDLATVEYRTKTFDPDAILYVVDHRQSDHFQKLFKCVAQTGLSRAELRHISFGTVLGKDGRPFKTRSGSVVGLEPLLDEAVSRAFKIVSDLDISDDEKTHISNVVGIGAIKYADLSHHRENDYEFDLDKMVQLEGNTAAYIQYSYARTQNILRKLAEKIASDNTGDLQTSGIAFEHPMERALAIQLMRFEDALQSSMVDYLPNFVTEYLYELAKLFASFFEQCPVLRASTPTQQASRRLLVSWTGKTLNHGLDLLNIQTVDRM